MRGIIPLLQGSTQEAPAFHTPRVQGWEAGRTRSGKVVSQSKEKAPSQAHRSSYPPLLVSLSGCAYEEPQQKA